MKKFTLFLAFMAILSFSKAQTGLDGIIVEKYYVTNAADSIDAAAQGAATVLHTGSITYRVFADLAPGYKFIALFGNQDALANPIHPMVIKTTTDFYNDVNYGVTTSDQLSLNNAKKRTALIDSWLAGGAGCSGKLGVLKTEDTDGSIGNANGLLTNTLGGVYGVAINSVVAANAQDGLLPGTVPAPNITGMTPAIDVFDQTAGSTFSITNGILLSLGGAQGATPSNMVLIGQFTTNGVLCFSLNIQISNTVTNVGEIYVPSNPQAGTGINEYVFPALAYCSGTIAAPTNTLPTISVTGPATATVGDVVTFSATAADADGTVTAVQFLVDGVNLGSSITGTTGSSTTYTANWTSVLGTHTVTAIATDNSSATANSNSFLINILASGTGTSTGVGITNINHNPSSFVIFPNPTKGIFTINVSNVKENANNKYSIYDVTGRLVSSKDLGKLSNSFSETVDLSGFNSGLYFINLSLDGVISTRKVIKE
jgi:hypothetical protein